MINFSIDPAPLATLPAAWLGLGEEVDGFHSGIDEGKWEDPAFRRAAAALARRGCRYTSWCERGVNGLWVDRG